MGVLPGVDSYTNVGASCHGRPLGRRKGGELLAHTDTRMNLQGIMLNEKSQSSEVIYCVVPLLCILEMTKL